MDPNVNMVVDEFFGELGCFMTKMQQSTGTLKIHTHNRKSPIMSWMIIFIDLLESLCTLAVILVRRSHSSSGPSQSWTTN